MKGARTVRWGGNGKSLRETRTLPNAFVSSFFLSVDLYGLDHTMVNDLSYIHSKNRLQRYQQFENSRKRRSRYRVNPEDYKITAATIEKYPIEFDSPVIFVKLQDVNDVNLGLRCGLVIRTDPIVEYEFFPDTGGDGNSGRYIRTRRARVDKELYELFPGS